MNQTLTNGLSLLLYLAESPEPHSISQLSAKFELPQSHVHRLLQTLLTNRYIEKDQSRRYFIGAGSLRLGSALLRQNPIRQTSLPHMARLASQLELSVTLAVPFCDHAIILAHLTHDGNFGRSYDTLGSVLSSHASASGKLFLAYRPEEQLAAVLDKLDYESFTVNTHRNAETLRQDLIEIVARGYSVNNMENGPDVVSLAAPIHDRTGRVHACLGLSGSVDMISPKRLSKLGETLRDAVGAIESEANAAPSVVESHPVAADL